MTWKRQQTIWEISDVTRLQAHKQLKDSVTDWSKQQWIKQSETKQNTGQTYKVTIHSLLYFITGPFKQHVKHQLQHYSWFTKLFILFSFCQFLHLKCFPLLFQQIIFHLLTFNLLREAVFDYCHLSPDKEVHISL